MADDGPRRGFNGEMPEPPRGEPAEVARAAWRAAWRAERLAQHADNHSADLFQQLGGLARKFTEEQARRFDEVNSNIARIDDRFAELEKRFGPQVEEAARNAKEARTSSSDLSDEVEKMEDALSKIKEKAIDSIRARAIAIEAHEVIITKDRLAELEKRERDAVEDRKIRDAERRNYKSTTRGLIVSGVVVAIVTAVMTYLLSRAPAPAPLPPPAPPATLH